MRRFFAGIVPNDESRAACASVGEELRATGFAAQYEAPERLHLTLAFLGFVESERADALIAGVHEAAATATPFSLVLDKLGAFPHERRPRVIYIGARAQGPQFSRLATAVRGAYAALGFSFDPDPVAHVTIARVKAPSRPLPLVDVAPITIPVGAVALFESLPDLAHATSRYELVAAAALAQADDESLSRRILGGD